MVNENGIGRPQSTIDWNKVDDLLVSGSSGAQIAARLGINKKTLYERTITDKCMSFTDYSQQKYEKGNSLLHSHQFAKALGFTSKGDTTLLIWLGKQRLGQTDQQSQLDPVNETLIGETIDNAKLRAELQKMKEKYEPETRDEHIRSEQAPKHMVRSCEIGEDI